MRRNSDISGCFALIGVLLFMGLVPYLLYFGAIILVIYVLIKSIPWIAKKIREYKKEQYFKSDEFLEHKSKIEHAVQEYNELSEYVDSFEEVSLQSDSSERYKYSGLAKYENTSSYNINREQNSKDLEAENIHYASLPVVRRASEEPFKYLVKYFDIDITEESLKRVQEIAETTSRFENAEDNLEMRLDKIEEDFDPPQFIKTYFLDELHERLEIEIPQINFQNPEYIFKYVSAGGNSSQTTTITFDEPTLEAFSEYLSERIKVAKSAKAQRYLMTKKLRDFIKERDDYTCQICGASTAKQSLLLLEVDHIIPIAKGGLSVEENLQTLCWKCNRSKSDKIYAGESVE